jgi:hypothetical protein
VFVVGTFPVKVPAVFFFRHTFFVYIFSVWKFLVLEIFAHVENSWMHEREGISAIREGTRESNIV